MWRFVFLFAVILAPASGSGETDCKSPFEITSESRAGWFRTSILIKVDLRNKSEERVGIRSSDVTFAGDLMTMPTLTLRPIDGSDPEFDLDPNESVRLMGELVLPLSAVLELYSGISSSDLTVKYKFEDADWISDSSKIELRPVAPSWLVFLGSLVGMGLSISFQKAYANYRGRAYSFSLSMLVAGFIALGVVIVIFRVTTSYPELPIKVEIPNLYGGVILGVLFAPVADWLAKKINPGEEKKVDGNDTSPDKDMD